jgi:hypothetical protein
MHDEIPVHLLLLEAARESCKGSCVNIYEDLMVSVQRACRECPSTLLARKGDLQPAHQYDWLLCGTIPHLDLSSHGSALGPDGSCCKASPDTTVADESRPETARRSSALYYEGVLEALALQTNHETLPLPWVPPIEHLDEDICKPSITPCLASQTIASWPWPLGSAFLLP